jgi:hypothetical protein
MTGSLTAAEIAACEASRDRHRARWAADLAARHDEPAEEPELIGATSVGAIVSDLDDVYRRMVEAYSDRHREHVASCEATYCDRCGRHACRRCRRVRVEDPSEACWGCLLREHAPAIGIPARYADAGYGPDAIATLRARVRSPEAIRATREAIRGELRSMVFAGPGGAGKSTLASAAIGQVMADALRRRPLRVPTLRWTSAIDLGLARSRHRLGSEQDPEAIVEAIEADVLVLDDLGAEPARDHDAIAQVIHGRHDADRPLWTTTGLTSAELAARYGGGIARRVTEGAVIIHCAHRPA